MVIGKIIVQGQPGGKSQQDFISTNKPGMIVPSSDPGYAGGIGRIVV
jgi:hypothetical protein